MRITRKILHNTIDNVINVYKCLKIYETEREREREREREYEKEKITDIKGSRIICLNSVNNKASGIILQELLIQQYLIESIKNIKNIFRKTVKVISLSLYTSIIYSNYVKKLFNIYTAIILNNHYN